MEKLGRPADTTCPRPAANPKQTQKPIGRQLSNQLGGSRPKGIHVNLADSASIDAAVTECGGQVDVLLSCAGVADGTPGIEKINFIGHRYLIDRLLAAGMMPRGSAIGFEDVSYGVGVVCGMMVACGG